MTSAGQTHANRLLLVSFPCRARQSARRAEQPFDDHAMASQPARDTAYAGEGVMLPPPVSLRTTSTRPNRPLVRIANTPMRVHWAKIKQKFGTASAPSESVMEGSVTEASSSGPMRAVHELGEKVVEDGEKVDVVVVDRDFHINGTETAPSTMDNSGKSGKSGHTGPTAQHAHGRPFSTVGGATERSSLMSRGTSLLSRLVPRPAIASLQHFFDMGSELQPQVEHQYRKEQWHLSKRIALMSSLFFILNWVRRPPLPCSRPLSRPLTHGFHRYSPSPSLKIL